MSVREFRAPGAATFIVCAVITVLAALTWVPTVAGLASLTGSDPAGNAMAQAYTAIAMGFLWLLLGLLALIAAAKGNMTRPFALAALLLIAACCVCSFIAFGMLSEPNTPPYLWPIIVPAAAPPIIVLLCFWALAPSLQRAVPPAIAGGVAFGALFALCAALYPMSAVRQATHEKEAAASRRYDEAFAALKADAPLWEWVRFLDAPNELKREEALKGMRALPRRQSEAELMLGRGDFPIGYLARLDIELTASVCDGARAQLRKQAAQLMPDKPGTRKYEEITLQVRDALAALKWLIGYGCDSDAEVTAWETAANAYLDTNYDVYELRDLHDPRLLGKVLRESPDKFSMLTQQSHLKAWLKFADEDNLRDKVLAGARTLPKRTADAVEIFNDPYSSVPPWVVLKYMPALDLDATLPRCTAAASRRDQVPAYISGPPTAARCCTDR